MLLNCKIVLNFALVISLLQIMEEAFSLHTVQVVASIYHERLMQSNPYHQILNKNLCLYLYILRCILSFFYTRNIDHP